MPAISKCRGDLVRQYREQRGWSQLELARRSGFSERLIRRLENGHAARQTTLAAVAGALSGNGIQITAQDLDTDPMAVAQAFVHAYLRHGVEAARLSAYLLHPDVVTVVHTDPNQLAFGGEFYGVEGLTQIFTTAYSQFEPVREDAGKWFTNGSRVAALRHQILRARSVPDGPELDTWILHEYVVTDGRIKRIDTYFDTAIYLRLLEYQTAEPHR